MGSILFYCTTNSLSYIYCHICMPVMLVHIYSPLFVLYGMSNAPRHQNKIYKLTKLYMCFDMAAIGHLLGLVGIQASVTFSHMVFFIVTIIWCLNTLRKH